MFGIKFEGNFPEGEQKDFPGGGQKNFFQLWMEAFGFTPKTLALTVLGLLLVNLLALGAAIVMVVWVLRCLGVLT